jgi:hypothetical protein
MRKTLVLCAFIALPAFAAQPLKTGSFVCEDMFYQPTPMQVSAYGEKIKINWEGRDRILHSVPTATGALRYEGAISKLVYIQTAKHSVVLNDATMKVVLHECNKVK